MVESVSSQAPETTVLALRALPELTAMVKVSAR